MWEAYGLENEDLLWASAGLFGGIAGQQRATCGAVSSAAVCLGLRHRRPLSDEVAVKQARLDVEKEAADVARDFTREFGTMICFDLVGVDLSVPEERRRFQETNRTRDTCDRYIGFVLGKLYDLEERRQQK